MRRNFLGIALALFLVIVPLNATPAFAKPSPSEVHYGCLGGGMISTMGMQGMIEVINVERSPYGPYDFMMMMIGPTVICVTDNADVVDDFEALMEGMGMPPITVVDDEDLEVWRRGKKVLAQTTEEVLGYPFYIEFRGIGGAETGMESMDNPNGWTMEASFTGFYAFVNVPAWEYTGVGQIAMRMRMTITYTPPPP